MSQIEHWAVSGAKVRRIAPTRAVRRRTIELIGFSIVGLET